MGVAHVIAFAPKASVLIVCSSCNVSQSLPMYECKQTQVSWLPFSWVERTNIKNGITKKCAKLQYWKDRMLIENKRIYKTWWTSIWRTYGIWWYEWGQDKPKWKASMMFMDVNHVHVEEGGKHGKVKGNTTPKIDYCLWVVHESWCCAKPPYIE